MGTSQLSFTVPRSHVKRFKSALESHQKLDRCTKIHPLDQDDGASFLVPTTIAVSCSGESEPVRVHEDGTMREALRSVGLEDYYGVIGYKLSPCESIAQSTPMPRGHANGVFGAALTWLQGLPPDLLHSLGLSVPTLMVALTKTYTIYEPLLLLPAHAFQDAAWRRLLDATSQSDVRGLYTGIARTMNITHMALNAPIPAHNLPPVNDTAEPGGENVLRSPRITLLYGDFGPMPSSSIVPTGADLDRAFWVSTRQSGIAQCWAPLYTMFSRGNVKEKARLMRLSSVAQSVREGKDEGTGCAAVDLYAGVGYFAFSYARAGVDVVLGWELNPWSVDGMKRGAKANKWAAEVRSEAAVDAVGALGTTKDERPTFLIFQESNDFASERIERLRHVLPPIRHVNCGLLPTSRGSWGTAVAVLDQQRGGWIHLHENIAVKEIDERAQEIVGEIRGICDRLARGDGPMTDKIEGDGSGEKGGVKLEHVERVKTYAPGVMHCVLDIRISPSIH